MEHISDTRSVAERLFVDQLTLIHRAITAVARQHRMSADDTEEFAATVHLRLIADDYAVLRKFRGQCSLQTFLRVVIQRICLDFRVAQWGKWRPSAAARRHGEIAIRLERLTMRDGLTFEEACEVLGREQREPLERDALMRIYSHFRVRTSRRLVGDDVLCHIPATHEAPDEAFFKAEQCAALSRALGVVSTGMRAISPRDQLMLQLRYVDGLTVAAIARVLRVDQKWLYRRYKHVLEHLRRHVEAHGVSASDVRPLLGGSVTVAAGLLDSLRVTHQPGDLIRRTSARPDSCPAGRGEGTAI